MKIDNEMNKMFLIFNTIQVLRITIALQRPGGNCAGGKLSMRAALNPVRCKRLLCRANGLTTPFPAMDLNVIQNRAALTL